MAANARAGPRGTGRDVLHEPAEIVHCGRGTARHAQHEVELHGSSGHLAFASHGQNGVQVAHLKALILRLDATLHHALAKSTHGRHGVVENLVAEVASTTVQRGHFRHGCGISGLQSLLRSHAHCTASGRNQNNIRASLVNGGLALLEAVATLRGRAVVLTHVQVHDGSTGIHGRLGFLHDFLHCIRHSRILFFRNFSTANSGGNYQFFHNYLV